MEATVTYAIDTGETPIAYPSTGGAQVGQTTGPMDARAVVIHNGRAASRPFSLEREGFLLVDHTTAVADFYDQAQIDSIYTDEVSRLVAAVTGARRVAVFDFTRRADAPDTREVLHTREPARTIHNDFTAWSACKRLRETLGDDESDRLQHRRFAIVNVWRPMLRAVETTPLAVCDATSVSADDLIRTERRSKDRVGEILQATYNPDHRWYFFPHMTPSEALLIKTYDSADDGRGHSTLHTAIDVPG